MKTELEWHKGPALGGEGTAGKNENGVPQWWDGDMLLIVVETSKDRDVALVAIAADEEYFQIRDVSTGDAYSDWSADDISWWAKVDAAQLPPISETAPEAV